MTLSPVRLDIDRLADWPLPLSFDAVKAHLGVDGTDDDALITRYVFAAIEWFEGTTHRTAFQRAHRWVLRDFPQTTYQMIRLPRGKTQSVSKIEYISGKQTVTLTGPSSGSPAGSDYIEDLRGDDGGLIMPNQGESWPSVDLDHPAPVTITFTAGWENDKVPADVVNAILFATADYMDIRSTTDVRPHTLDPKEALASPYRLTRWY